jgi:stearoyl-CoA desaturase (delta-9 desaturase)
MVKAPAGCQIASREEKEIAPTNRFSPLLAVYFIAVHAGALISLAWFSWTNLAVMLILYVMTGIGITVGYHRLLAHRSFRVPRWLEYSLATLGATALQGSPTTWVSDHRQHHFHSDHNHDPHDINRGLLFAHMGWIFYLRPDDVERQRKLRLARDLMTDPYYRWLDRFHYVPGFAVGVALLLAGGLPLFLWGFCMRLVVLYHSTWLVNSAAHAWGYRNFHDVEGANNWLVALLAFGEGWHNNHHAWPTSARHGMRPWEIDVSWWLIATLRRLRIARDVTVYHFDATGNGRLLRD